jgi:hypothetical protein
MSTYENRPYSHCHDYEAADFASEVDLKTDDSGPRNAEGDGPRNRPARRLEARSAGTLAVRWASGGEEQFTVLAADLGTSGAIWEAHFCDAILSATDVDLRVSW